MKKLNIVFLIPEFCVGGVERVLLTLLKALDSDKFQITVVARNPGEWDRQLPSNMTVRYLFSTNPRLSGPLKSRLYKYLPLVLPKLILRRLVNLPSADITIAFHEPMLWLLRAARGKKVAWIHSDYSVVRDYPAVAEISNFKSFLRPFVERVINITLQECARVVCVSKAIMPGIINKAKLNEKDVVCRYNINDDKWMRGLAEDSWQLPDAKGLNFVSVGRFVEQKAFDRLIRAVAILKDEGYQLSLYIVGDGPLYPKLKNMVQELDLESDVFLLGYDANPYKYMAKVDMFVCSSKWEAFCTATTESIILGVPVLTTSCAGMEELIGESGAGVIVDNNTKSLVTGFRRVLSDASVLDQLRSSARQRSAHFSSEVLVGEIECDFLAIAGVYCE